MNDFPFQVVYDHFAKPLVKVGLDKGIFPPLMYVVLVDENLAADNRIADLYELPQSKIGSLFQSGKGKEKLGEFIRMSMSTMGGMSACMVLISEVWTKRMTIEDAAKRDPKISLEDDAEATEAIMITIYRPEGERMGKLPINADRTVSYAPLEEFESVRGRLALHDEEEAKA